MNRNRSRTQSAFGRLDGFDTRGGPLDGPFDVPDAEVRLEQQEQLDYWAAFRRGLNDEKRWIRDHRAGRRRPIYELYTVPKRRTWTPEDQPRPWTPPGDQGQAPDVRDPTRPRMLQVDRQLPGHVRYHIIQALQNPERLRRADGEIIRGENPIMTALQPLGFRFKKTLGQGGGGIAILVDLLDESGKADEWVIKAPIRRGNLSREAINMRLMVGARHMVQRKFISVPDPGLPADGPTLNSDRRDCLIGMELLKHGSLDALLRKVSERNLKLRDDELWMIFHCLLRACVAMARPGTWDGGLTPERDRIPLRDEDIQENGPVETVLSLLHFDIDPDNILIGDYESDPGSHTHETVPIFKISDLGVALRLDEMQQMKNDMYTMLSSRKMGKVENHTPEQFTEEWDYLAEPPAATNEPVAGNYTWKNNLYGVGNVMWMLMTRCCTGMPPVATEVFLQITDVDTVHGYTYGYDLFQEGAEDYHPTLKSLVIWCMMHDPAKRPDFRQLEYMILGNIRGFQRDGDQNTQGRTSIRDILSIPPPPPSPPPPPPASVRSSFAAGEDPGAWILGGGAAAGIQHVRWTSSGWQALDAGIEGAGGGGGGDQQPAVAAVVRPRRSNLRAAVRSAFRPSGGGGGGGGLRNLAQRAGRGIRRVFRGAVRRVSGSGGPLRRSQPGSATVSRPAAQEADGGRGTMANLQFAMAAMGVVYPGNMAWVRRRQRAGDNQGAPPAP